MTTVTDVPAVTGERKAAGIRCLDMTIRNWWRTAGIWRRIEHGYWRLYHLRTYWRYWRTRHDQDAWLKQVRVGTVPDPQPEEDEIYWETFDPEDWIGSTAN
jgi:hypothetical protein